MCVLLCCQPVFCCIQYLQFHHCDGSWRLVVSYSSSRHENLVLRVVFRIRLYLSWQEHSEMAKGAVLFPQLPTTLSHQYQLVQPVCLGLSVCY